MFRKTVGRGLQQFVEISSFAKFGDDEAERTGIEDIKDFDGVF